jgi:hypothetical protein
MLTEVKFNDDEKIIFCGTLRGLIDFSAGAWISW